MLSLFKTCKYTVSLKLLFLVNFDKFVKNSKLGSFQICESCKKIVHEPIKYNNVYNQN